MTPVASARLFFLIFVIPQESAFASLGDLREISAPSVSKAFAFSTNSQGFAQQIVLDCL